MSSKKIEPLENRILIRPNDPTTKSKGGIIIPDNAREKPCEGVVIEVGPGKRTDSGEVIPPYVQAGDTVLYSKYAGTEIKIDDQDHIVLRETEVICRITESEVPAAV